MAQTILRLVITFLLLVTFGPLPYTSAAQQLASAISAPQPAEVPSDVSLGAFESTDGITSTLTKPIGAFVSISLKTDTTNDGAIGAATITTAGSMSTAAITNSGITHGDNWSGLTAQLQRQPQFVGRTNDDVTLSDRLLGTGATTYARATAEVLVF